MDILDKSDILDMADLLLEESDIRDKWFITGDLVDYVIDKYNVDDSDIEDIQDKCYKLLESRV